MTVLAMDIDIYLSLVKEKCNKPCTIRFKSGHIEEGVYLGESPNLRDLGMKIRPMGESRKRYQNIGISDPNPQKELGDTLEVKNLSLLISEIDSINFDEND